ncbi:hypothetical protein BD311DRAFT_737768 [Dichomitus squalens]|uniref:Uncharacterized protein n=1 Tax=Dichomitus squalens TaxID=114155 RepID=A0A4Q9MWU1_9APHY|nr:hypothetical protein BD311DRAFT_737768 [Dichomitus squalens]
MGATTCVQSTHPRELIEAFNRTEAWVEGAGGVQDEGTFVANQIHWQGPLADIITRNVYYDSSTEQRKGSQCCIVEDPSELDSGYALSNEYKIFVSTASRLHSPDTQVAYVANIVLTALVLLPPTLLACPSSTTSSTVTTTRAITSVVVGTSPPTPSSVQRREPRIHFSAIRTQANGQSCYNLKSDSQGGIVSSAGAIGDHPFEPHHDM